MLIGNVEWDRLPEDLAIEAAGGRPPLSHKRMALATHAAIRAGDMDILDCRAWLSPDERDSLTATAVRVPGCNPPPDCTFCIGVKASHRKRCAARWFVGLTFDGEGRGLCLDRDDKGKKSSHQADASEWLERATDVLAARARQYVAEMKWTHRHRMTDEQALQYLVKMVRRNQQTDRMPWGKIGLVDKAFRRMGGETAWDLLVSFAGVACSNREHGVYLFDQLYRFYEPLKLKAQGGIQIG